MNTTDDLVAAYMNGAWKDGRRLTAQEMLAAVAVISAVRMMEPQRSRRPGAGIVESMGRYDYRRAGEES